LSWWFARTASFFFEERFSAASLESYPVYLLAIIGTLQKAGALNHLLASVLNP